MYSQEQLEGKTDARSDIFSFGAMLYEMITGRRCFEEYQPGDPDCRGDIVQPAAGLDDPADGVTGARPCRTKMPRQGSDNRWQSARTTCSASLNG